MINYDEDLVLKKFKGTLRNKEFCESLSQGNLSIYELHNKLNKDFRSFFQDSIIQISSIDMNTKTITLTLYFLSDDTSSNDSLIFAEWLIRNNDIDKINFMEMLKNNDFTGIINSVNVVQCN